MGSALPFAVEEGIVSAVARLEVGQRPSSMDAMRTNIHLIESPEQGAHVLSQIEALREAFKKLKDAEDQRIAAVRLELALIRRIGQLGGMDLFGSQKRAMCRDLAAMTDDEFEKCTDFVDGRSAPIVAFRAYRAQTPEALAREAEMQKRAEENRRAFWERMTTDDGFRSAYDARKQSEEREINEGRTRQRVSELTASLLIELDMSDRPFTTRELANEVASKVQHWGLEEECEFSTDPAFSQMISEVARGAMRKTTAGEDYPYTRVTFIADGEYLHIPWQIATVDHVSAYADYAQAQADEMQRKASKARAVAEHYRSEASAAGLPSSTPVIRLTSFRELTG